MFRKVNYIFVSIQEICLVNVKWKKYKIGGIFHVARDVFFWVREYIEIEKNCYIGRNSQIECMQR